MIRQRKEELNSLLKCFSFSELQATRFYEIFNRTIEEYGFIAVCDLFDPDCPDSWFLLTDANQGQCEYISNKDKRLYTFNYVDRDLGWTGVISFRKMFKPRRNGFGIYVYDLNLPKLEDL